MEAPSCGAGAELHRAFGFGKINDICPFLPFDDFRNENPEDYLAGFPCIRIEGSKPLPTCSSGRRSMAEPRQ